ncbi:MAG: methyl-accepting chemotaxis protein, partial [Cellvibrionaceae bacterium]
MKLSSDFFRGRYWQPGLIIGTIFFLVLTAYLGYRIWENSRADLENVQQIREFQSSSANALFFSKKAVTGDPTAIDPLGSTVDLMDETLTKLQQADDFTKDMLGTEYEQSVNLWRNVKDNADVLAEVEYAINLLNAVHERLGSGAVTSEKIALNSVELLSADNAARSQVTGVSRQAILMRQMTDNLGQFIEQEKSDRQGFDNFRANFIAFEQNHADLMNGSAARNVRAITNPRVRAGLEQMNGLLDGVRTADSYILAAVERMLLARDAQQRIISSFEDLQFSLDDMSSGIVGFANERFPRLIHAIFSAIAFLVCVVGLILYQRIVSKEELDREHEEGQRTQGAILRLLDELVDLADGDLTISATVSEDFTGAIADSINFTIDQLRQLVSRINSTAVQVSQAAQGTQQTALHLAEASDHQAQEIAGASAAINEMAVTIDQVSANASESALVAGKSVSIANNGAKLVQNTIHGMDTIREQ